MRPLLFFLILFFTKIVSAQEIVNIYYPQLTDTTGNKLPKELKMSYEAIIDQGDTIRVGEFISYYPLTGNTKSTGHYNSKGIKKGIWIDYYDNGQKKWIRAYDKYGYTRGDEYFYNHGGQLVFKSSYVFKSENGDDKIYHFKKYYGEDSTISAESDMINGQFHGEFKEYYRNGALKSVSEYVHGKRIGTFKVLAKNGTPVQLGKYCNGALCDTLFLYYDNGAVKAKGKFKNNLPNGFMYEFYPSAQLKRVSFYENDTLNGECLRFYENGQLESRSEFVMGHIHGDFIAFHPNGEKNQEYRYQFGLRQGTYLEYDTSGVLSRKLHYKDDQLNGEALSFYPNGDIKQRYAYVNGERKGTQLTFYPNSILKQKAILKDTHHPTSVEIYDEDGNLIQKETYKYKTEFDQNIGKKAEVAYKEVETYYDDEKVHTIHQFKNKWKHGLQVEYYKNGRKLEETPYEFDQIHGKKKTFEKSGKLSSVENYERGHQQGMTILYRKGKKLEEFNFKRDLLNGVYKKFNTKNGKALITGNYKKDKKHGKWNYYSKKGELIKSETYKEGNLIEENQ